MQFKTFEEGFRYELANRDFARTAMTRLRSRTRRRVDGDFWGGYARLEEFNAPIYAAAARRLGVVYSTGAWTRLRGKALGAVPVGLFPEVLRLAYPRTVEYLEDIRWMRSVGPDAEAEFLGYMEEQEDVQVKMMHAALRKDYPECRRLVDEFVEAWGELHRREAGASA